MDESSTRELRNRQDQFIAQGCLTNSKHPSCFVEGVYPTHILSGLGAYVKCSDQKEYIDMISGLGSLSLGHRHSFVDQEVMKVIQNHGVNFSLPTPFEADAADYLLSEFLPKYDAVKYLKTGAEATSAAIRIARSATKRNLVLSVGYHGWHDFWLSTKVDPQGLGEKFNHIEFPSIADLLYRALEGDPGLYDLDEVAAVIVEPIMLEHSEKNTAQLFQLKEICQRHGILLIFDEIVCGSRIPEFAISAIVNPDVVCLGKGIANGYPLAAVVGRKDLMQETPYFVSSTYAGEIVSLSAHLKTMRWIRKEGFQHIYDAANKTMTRTSLALKEVGVKLEGYGTRGFFSSIDPLKLGLFFQQGIHAQVLFGKSWFYGYSHFAVDSILNSRVADICYQLKNSRIQLKGKLPKEPFKRL